MKEKSCCFTGHRKIDSLKVDYINEITRNTIIDLIENKDVSIFYNGMAIGFDLLAARIVVELKDIYPYIQLICVIPFKGQENHWNGGNRNLYKNILGSSNERIYIQETFTYSAYQRRNVFMVDNSKYVIAFFDGSRGGTKNTLDYAKRYKTEIININSFVI